MESTFGVLGVLCDMVIFGVSRSDAERRIMKKVRGGSL
jgi:hypothetical protein